MPYACCREVWRAAGQIVISVPPCWAAHAVLVGWARNPLIAGTGLVIAMYHEWHEVNTWWRLGA